MSSVSRKTALVAGAVVFVLRLATYGVVAGSRNRSSESENHHDPRGAEHASINAEQPASNADAENKPVADNPQVSIDNFTFSPAKLTIPVGATVTWTNHDDVPHTATGTNKPKAFDSGVLDTDQGFSHTFSVPGTYDYFCAVHPHMTGQIVVK